jgi:hypothetical protein
MDNKIEIDFDFYSDTPANRDPDSYSPTLRRYHRILWSKPLPDGEFFNLVEKKQNAYLYHKSGIGEFFFGSDAITHSYRNTKKMSHIINQVPIEKVDSLFKYGSTIGAYIIFPCNRINNQMTINGARGLHSKIQDRFDLTLECIRLFYDGVENPLSSVFNRYTDFFNLFKNFKGYVEFFLLQDLVTDDFSKVKCHLPHKSFEESPLPSAVNEYLEYRKNTVNFVRARGRRIAALNDDSFC